MAEVHGGSGRGSPEPPPPKPARLTLSSAVENEISGEEYEDRIDFRYVQLSVKQASKILLDHSACNV